MKKGILLASLFCLVAAGTVFGQAKLKRANKAYANLDYIGAIEMYTQVLDKRDVSEAKINLADCYRKISNTAEAEYWYGQVVRLPEAEPTHYLFYGMMLHTNGKCELAQEWFDKYIAAVPDDLRGQYLAKACDYEEEYMTKNAGIYDVKHLPFNTSKDDFSPMIYKDGVVFTSEYLKSGPVKREHTWTGDPFTELFYVNSKKVSDETMEHEYGKAEKFSNRINSKYHDATASFSEGDKQIFFTRNNLFKGKTGRDDNRVVRLKIFYAESADGGTNWTNIQGVPFNSDEYSVAHPTLSTDGSMLYFSSDMPGGFGGMDLYASEFENGRWGPPLNLGPSINTEGNEIFPYYSKDSKLYFSSDGHIGLGGLDIFSMDDNDGNWSDISNIGYPLNSISDDFGIVLNEENNFGYFTSDREGGTGDDDIYSFFKQAAPVQIYVFDEATGQPIEGAVVKNDCNDATLTTDAKGYATIEMKLNQCCKFEASKEAYDDNDKEGCTKNVKAGEKTIVEIPLTKPIEALAFDLRGRVLDKSTGEPVEGAEVTLTNDCGDMAPETFVTDATGVFEFDLKEDCCYTVKSNKMGFLSSTIDKQCTKGLTQSTTLQTDLYLQKYVREPGDVVTTAPSPSTTTRSVDTYTNTTTYPSTTTTPSTTNSTTTYSGPVVSYADNGSVGAIPFLLHIYYDFDQSYIRSDAEPELNKLYQILIDNPELVVEIGSHTDSRGSFRYNDRLSQRRAEAVIRWLRTKGISKVRLKPKGYGENNNVNQCANNVPCSEQEHQWNRRTEFRVVGVYTAEGQYKEIDSTRPSDVQVDPCQGCPF